MIVGVPKEVKASERRVALTPLGARDMTARGHRVLVETGAGLGSSIPDTGYEAAGAVITPTAADVFQEADLIVKVKEPQLGEIEMLRAGQMLFTYLHLAAYPEIAEGLRNSGVTGIAYETVQLGDGSLPLLAPMSEIAGRMSVQVGSRWLESSDGGKGKLLGGAAGVPPAKVTVLGAGISGKSAARVATGMGAQVTVLDIDPDKLRALIGEGIPGVFTCYSSVQTVEENVLKSDLVIGAVLVAGGQAPKLIDETLVRQMEPGTVMVDISIDQGGCFATSHETTHEDPVFRLHDVIHYAVGNIPGVVPHTSTYALTNATLRYLLAMASDLEMALCHFPELTKGINVVDGHFTHPEVALALGEPFTDPMIALGIVG